MPALIHTSPAAITLRRDDRPRRRRPSGRDALLRDTAHRTKVARDCDGCGEIHEPGAWMHQSVAVAAGALYSGHFCIACGAGAYQQPEHPIEALHSRWADLVDPDQVARCA